MRFVFIATSVVNEIYTAYGKYSWNGVSWCYFESQKNLLLGSNLT